MSNQAQIRDNKEIIVRALITALRQAPYQEAFPLVWALIFHGMKDLYPMYKPKIAAAIATMEMAERDKSGPMDPSSLLWWSPFDGITQINCTSDSSTSRTTARMVEDLMGAAEDTPQLEFAAVFVSGIAATLDQQRKIDVARAGQHAVIRLKDEYRNGINADLETIVHILENALKITVIDTRCFAPEQRAAEEGVTVAPRANLPYGAGGKMTST